MDSNLWRECNASATLKRRSWNALTLSSTVLNVPSERPIRIMTHGCMTLVTADEDIMTSTLHVNDVSVGAVKIFAASSALLIIERLIVLSATDPFKY